MTEISNFLLEGHSDKQREEVKGPRCRAPHLPKDKGGAKKHSFTTHAKLKHDSIILNINNIFIELIEVVNFSNCLKGNYSVLL